MKKQEKIKEFKRMGRNQLLKVLADDREKLRQFRFDLSAGKVKNVREIREVKKDIARIKTLITPLRR